MSSRTDAPEGATPTRVAPVPRSRLHVLPPNPAPPEPRPPLGLRRGELVEVRSLEAIRATLDARGALEGLPFMPEMEACAGGVYRVAGRAGRICVEGAPTARRVEGAVYLDAVRCDGEAHGGCRRGCLLLWKEAWLERAASPWKRCGLPDDPLRDPAGPPAAPAQDGSPAVEANEAGEGGAWTCQSTALYRASTPMPTGRIGSRLAELRNGDASVREIVEGIAASVLRRPLVLLRSAAARRRGEIGDGPLGLRPGEWVEVKTLREILRTLDGRGRNRGLEFCAGMELHCGGRYRVARRVDRIILENSGRMRAITGTVALEGVACGSCSRRSEFYFREAWLRRA